MKSAMQDHHFQDALDEPAAGPESRLDVEPSTLLDGDSARTLPRVRARLLDALRREDFCTIQAELPAYQELLVQAAEAGGLSQERLARLEAEHHRFHEQLRATLLTTRIRLRIDLERLIGARLYLQEERRSEGIDVRG